MSLSLLSFLWSHGHNYVVEVDVVAGRNGFRDFNRVSYAVGIHHCLMYNNEGVKNVLQRLTCLLCIKRIGRAKPPCTHVARHSSLGGQIFYG